MSETLLLQERKVVWLNFCLPAKDIISDLTKSVKDYVMKLDKPTQAAIIAAKINHLSDYVDKNFDESKVIGEGKMAEMSYKDKFAKALKDSGNSLADMSDDEKEYYRSITIRLKFKNNTIYNLEEGDPELEFMSKNRGSIRPLIGQHPHTGQDYFYFPYHFICGAWEGKKKIDHQPLIDKLMPHIFKSQYQYHHIFKKGDFK